MRLLDAHGIGQASGGSITTSEPTSLISAPSAEAITRDSNEATWEEMEAVIGKETNTTVNTLLLMGACGVLATIGIATNALHLVVAAMVLAPGSEPITRIALGLVARSLAWRRGLADMVALYGALFLGAAVTTLVLQALGLEPFSGEATYLPAGALSEYWGRSPNTGRPSPLPL